MDYVITQLDVSRMARVDTRDMRHHAAGVRRPPGAFSADTSLILSSHEGGEQDVDAILQRCAPVIEVYFESNLDNVDTDRLGHGIDDDDPCQFSWMMVSSDVKEDGMTRMSASDIIGDVPVSISICKTNDFVNLECNNTNTLDYCVACKNLFQDGDSLHILPCQHLYHRGCIDTWQAGGFSRNESSICPLCDKAQEKTSSQQEDYEDKRVKASSWGLVRLGSLLSS
ncbi:hypothetical protein ACHAXA_001975 [Cyclostephanos tholiformis]|uniref:RING-type domain-containing protein n=1 Tax=Cyclostephanos tholiformis TaxID=382380 RepID=A0ABD3SDG5_9STRA